MPRTEGQVVEPQPKRGGRPPFVPTNGQRQAVQAMAANRVPQEIIARSILRYKDDRVGIDLKTLRKVFRLELDEGYAQTVARMGMAVVRSGLGGNVMAQRYWLETHGGDEWKRTENLRHGLTPDAAASRQNLIAPVLVIQPVTTLEALEMDKRNDRAPAVLERDDSGETGESTC